MVFSPERQSRPVDLEDPREDVLAVGLLRTEARRHHRDRHARWCRSRRAQRRHCGVYRRRGQFNRQSGLAAHDHRAARSLPVKCGSAPTHKSQRAEAHTRRRRLRHRLASAGSRWLWPVGHFRQSRNAHHGRRRGCRSSARSIGGGGRDRRRSLGAHIGACQRSIRINMVDKRGANDRIL